MSLPEVILSRQVPVKLGGTGLTSVGPAGSALLSDGKQLYYGSASILPPAASIATIVALTATQIAGLVTGTAIWVDTLSDYFVWQADSTITADSITVVNPTANGVNPGRFLRDSVVSTRWLNQVDFYVDETNGNDEYDGTLATHTTGFIGPVKTYDEIVRRLGNVIRPIIAQTIHQVGNYAGIATLVIENAAPGRITIQGELPAASFTGTLSAVTNLNAGTSTPTDATSTWVPATELNRIVKNTTKSTWSWIAKDLTGNKARVSPWTTVDLVNGGGSVTIGNAAIGDSVSSYVLPTLGSLNIVLLTGAVGTVGTSPVIINQLDLTGTSGTSRIFGLGTQICVQNCKISGTLRSGGLVLFNNCCKTAAGGTFVGNDGPTAINLNSGLMANGFTVTRNSMCSILSQTLFQNAQITVGILCRLVVVDGCWCDTTNPILLGARSILEVQATMWGTGNTGAGVVMQRCSTVDLGIGITPTLTGANDFTFAGATQAYAWDDASHVYTAAKRNLTWTLVQTTFGGGGFGGACIDPATGCAVVANV